MTSGVHESGQASAESARHRARRKAFELLFELEQHPGLSAGAALARTFGDPDVLETYCLDEDSEGYALVPATPAQGDRYELAGHAKPMQRFVTELVEAVCRHQRQIDAELSRYPEDWSYERIGLAERILLRLAVAEMAFIGTGHKVVINETLELAKDYCQEEAVPFINGILGGVVANLARLRESDPEADAKPWGAAH
jgi:transcription antitermination factor NusB